MVATPIMKRLALVTVLLLSGVFATAVSRATPTATVTTPTGQPLFQFVNSGVGPLPWNAQPLSSVLNGNTMIGGPHAASGPTAGVVAFTTNGGHLGLFTQPTTGAATFADRTLGNATPTPAGDPVPFFSPSGDVDILYVDDQGHLQVQVPNDPRTPFWAALHDNQPWRPFVTRDLSAQSNIPAGVGVPGVSVVNGAAVIAFNARDGSLAVIRLTWPTASPIPVVDASGSIPSSQLPRPAPPTTTTSVRPTTTTTSTTTTVVAPHAASTTTTTVRTTTTTVKSTTTTTVRPTTTTSSTSTSTTTSTTSTTSTSTTSTTVRPTTTTTAPVSAAAFASDPVVLPQAVPTVAVEANNGDLFLFSSSDPSLDVWTSTDLTVQTSSADVQGSLAVENNSQSVFLAATSVTGSVLIFSAPYAPVVPQNVVSRTALWTVKNATGLSPGAPPLTGTLALSVSDAAVTIAGQASNWGDLFVLTNNIGSNVWTNTDVSVTGGSAARTVGDVVAALQVGTSTVLYAAGINSPPPQGVGLYAIPQNKWPTAITDGWPIISETGALGTLSNPWVGFTRAISVSQSPDFLMGQAIQNSHKRVTWLSFWTVSGPLSGETQNADTYYLHGKASGAWVATQIDAYRGLGVGIKPDWVIFDPEGWPDAHSRLDAPPGSSKAVMALYATYWTAMLKGWADGLASVDPTLNAGVYANQSEYRNYGLASNPLPFFEAIAFGKGGPVALAGAQGSNVRGYIAFSATCKPITNQPLTLAQQIATLRNPPWSGRFNTLQFNAGVYCPPPAT